MRTAGDRIRRFHRFRTSGPGFSCVGDIWEGDIACNRGNDDDEQPALSALASLQSPYIDE